MKPDELRELCVEAIRQYPTWPNTKIARLIATVPGVEHKADYIRKYVSALRQPEEFTTKDLDFIRKVAPKSKRNVFTLGGR
jgi:hypothetical protein